MNELNGSAYNATFYNPAFYNAAFYNPAFYNSTFDASHALEVADVYNPAFAAIDLAPASVLAFCER
jgi:hypothetical protein